MAETRHKTTARTYYVTYLALLALTGLTFAASAYPLGLPEMVVALTIAGIKSLLVGLFFMHLIEQRLANRLVAVVSILYVVLLVALVAADIATRHTFPPAVEMKPRF